MAQFCRLHSLWLKAYFQLPCGIPSHDTFCRALSAVEPAAFQECFFIWIKSVIEIFPENVIPIDGKSIRASRREKRNLKALHIVSTFSCANGISLGQMIVDKKTNEITAIPALLKKLCIEGAIITLDAMGCQSAIAKQIIEQKGDYILRVKDNQSGLLDAIETTHLTAEKSGYENMVYYTAEDEINNDHRYHWAWCGRAINRLREIIVSAAQPIFEFRRRIDAVTYRFFPCEPIDGKLAWKREDIDLWITEVDGFGWACIDCNEIICGTPWGIAFKMMGKLPPEGEWISKKGDKSYVYDVRCFYL